VTDGVGTVDDAVEEASVAELPVVAPSNRWRLVRRVLAGLIAVLAVYYLANLWLVFRAGNSDQARPVDAIVVLGAAQYDGQPSPQLAARLDHVVQLWDGGVAPLVVTTGGNRPGDRFTEAQASAAYLEERGVPADAIGQGTWRACRRGG